jgi:uncharacterized membrane protein YhiD involved in acid resistance
MNKIETFEQFMATTKGNLGINDFMLNIAVAAVLSFILGWVYVKYGRSLSNRKQFAANFIMITLTTMVIISIVKSSLALSLGLVGALSIVRFRTAIKEPEELSYMFLSIAIGLGLGASQTQVTIFGFAFIVIIIIIRGLVKRSERSSNFFITMQSENNNIKINELNGILSKHCSKAEIRRIDDQQSRVEIVLLIEFDKPEGIQGLRDDLRNFDPTINFSMLENKGLI